MSKEIIKVPESIGIFKVNQPVNRDRYGDGLLIGFNNNKQMLGFDTTDNIYVVSQRGNLTRIDCDLILCKKNDLKIGDTVYISITSTRLLVYEDIFRFCKIEDVANNSDIIKTRFATGTNSIGFNSHNHKDIFIYKLVESHE